MPSIGGLEMLVLLVLAIVVVGPKDLPRMLRSLGQWVSKARALAAEFRAGLDQIAREQELEELRRQVNELKRGEPLRAIQRDIEKAAALDGEDSLGSYEEVGMTPPTEEEAKTPGEAPAEGAPKTPRGADPAPPEEDALAELQRFGRP